ncbi:MAG TPA: hypothetical protein VGR08_13395 [Thermomicrobiales bacterium]|nr:hypothetical protein [Thermomicrobiales bacterium]
MNQGYVYMLANSSTTPYTGVASDLEQRIWRRWRRDSSALISFVTGRGSRMPGERR